MARTLPPALGREANRQGRCEAGESRSSAGAGGMGATSVARFHSQGSAEPLDVVALVEDRLDLFPGLGGEGAIRVERSPAGSLGGGLEDGGSKVGLVGHGQYIVPGSPGGTGLVSILAWSVFATRCASR
jgi:hypothetical protein